PVSANSFFSGAGILIFSKPGFGKTDNTWFYKMKAAKSRGNVMATEHDEVLNILRLWKKRGENISWVTVDEIRNNNYNLNFNQYKAIEKEDQLAEKVKDVDNPKKNSATMHENEPGEPADEKRPAMVGGKTWILI